MRLVDPTQAAALGARAGLALCQGDATYRAFWRAAEVILQPLSHTFEQVSIFVADPQEDVFHEEAIAGPDGGQGSDELPMYQLPDALLKDGRAVERSRGPYRQLLAPIRLAGQLIGLLSLTSRAGATPAQLDAVAALADALAPGVGYALQRRAAEQALSVMHAAAKMSRELVGVSGFSPDRLLYRFVSLVVEQLKFDRATLVVFSEEQATPARVICASLGRPPTEINPERLPPIPHLITDDPLPVQDVPGVWIPINLGRQRLGALLADNLYSLETPSRETIQSLIDLTGQVALSLENVRLFERLQAMALRDDLTGLFRPGYFYERLQEELARLEQEGEPAALIFIDLDDFKAVNDTYGHRAGDALLVQVAQELKSGLRPRDVVCRMGGDEFIVFLPRVKETDAVAIAQRVCDRIARKEYVLPDGARARVRVSAGVSLYPQNARDWQKLIHRADQAMYFAKRSGKGRVYTAALT